MTNTEKSKKELIDSLKGINSKEARARAEKRREIEEFFMLQHLMASMGFCIFNYFCVVYVIGHIKEIQNFKSNNEIFFYFFVIWASTISVFLIWLSAKSIVGLILYLTKYISLLKVIIHTAVISALATALSFFVNSEFAANYLKSIGPEGPQIINNYYMFPVIIYFLFFTAVGFYYLFRKSGHFGKSNNGDKHEHTN